MNRYKFGVLEDSGWNFRHAYYHQLNKRTLLKAYGLKFIIQVWGRIHRYKVSDLHMIRNFGKDDILILILCSLDQMI